MLALLLADGRTPTGGYAHSGGLEPSGLGAADVPGFIAARLRTAGRVEAAAAVLAARGADPEELAVELAARTPSAAARAASQRLGAALLRTGQALFGDLPDRAFARPIVLGLVGARAGLSAVEIARLSLYEDAATVAAAAPKLMPVDAVEATRWVAAAAPLVETLSREAADATELPAAAAPLLDLRAERHANDTRRLFAS